MAPKNFVFLLVLGLCATQMVSAHRQARSVAGLVESAKAKLGGLLAKVEDAAASSVKTVWNYIQQLESKALEAGSSYLKANGVDINLADIAGLFKDNIKICVNEENVKKDARVIIDNVASCVTKDVNSMKNLIEDMKDLWHTAQDLPQVMQDVAKTCSANSDTDDKVDVLASEENDLDQESTELIEAASHHLSKRDLWGLSRIVRCTKAVYGLTKTDLVTIPGEILSTAANAFRMVQSAQGGIQACVARRVAENVPAITKLSMSVSTCVAAGVSEGDDLEAVLAANPALEPLRKIQGVAKQLQGLQNLQTSIQSNNAVKAMQTVARIAG